MRRKYTITIDVNPDARVDREAGEKLVVEHAAMLHRKLAETLDNSVTVTEAPEEAYQEPEELAHYTARVYRPTT